MVEATAAVVAEHAEEITGCFYPAMFAEHPEVFRISNQGNHGGEADGAQTGYMDLGDVALPDNVQVFTCGPLPFMRMVRSTLLKRGVPSDHIRYEVFGPDLWAAGDLD